MRSDSTLAVIFFTRNNRKDFTKLAIYARITVNGRRTEISLKRYVSVNDWDTSKGRGRGNSYPIKQLNAYLDEVYTQILKAHKVLVEEHIFVTSQSVKSRFLGEDDHHKTLMELVDYHNNNMVKVLSSGTMKNYYTTEKYLIGFIGETTANTDIYLKQLNYRFIVDFEQYIRTYKPKKKRKTCTNNGTMKHLERLRKMVNLAVKLEWLEKDPFQKFQLKFNKHERHYLTQRELDRIEQTEFKSQGYERVKDIFLFASYTGLSYVDLKELSPNHLVRGIKGNLWIHTQRAKTNEAVKIPLLPKAKEILAKYSNLNQQEIKGKLLPVYSNQKTNKYLKEIAKACGIHKNISFHVARHTFATTVTLSNGVPIETVSKLLGHTKLTTTQIYARVLQKKVGEDMEHLIQHYENKEKQERNTQISTKN